MLGELAGQAAANLRAHGRRSALTLSGIVWGTALVILLVTWGAGLRDTLVEQVSAGGRHMMLFFGGRSSSGVGANRGGHEVRLTREDCTLVGTQLASVLERTSCGTIRWGGVYVRAGGESRNVTTFGIDLDAAALMELRPAAGRFFDAVDLAQHRRVALLGADLKTQLFGTREAVGERLEVNGVGYDVIGVLAKKGDQIASLGPADDKKLFLPLTTFQKLVSGDDWVTYVGVAPRVPRDHKAVVEQVRKVLGARHGFETDDQEALSVFDVINFVDLFSNLLGAVQGFVAMLGMVTLSIGGVGVMNILLLAVTERTPEIGLRKAVGARRRHIVLQFLIEGLCMTGFGGLLGIVLGTSLCLGLGTQGPVDVPAFLSGATIVFSAGLITIVGLGAGVWPAVRAARIDPVVALRFQ